jgi:microsomal dipeptidase-like Zn-dependent dipeptidase
MKVFDFHFHLLFKHYITTGFDQKENVKMKGFADLLDAVFGGPFDSQASPLQVSKSNLNLGVIGLVGFEHAFANRILHFRALGINLDLSQALPMNWDIVNNVKDGKISYYDDFKAQLDDYVKSSTWLQKPPYNIHYLNRKDWSGKTSEEIQRGLTSENKRWFAFSIEGGHNLSQVPVNKGIQSLHPEFKLKELQDAEAIDFISINLCHLSHIPEQNLGGFCQGLNKTSQIAFASEDFTPKTGFGLTPLGRKVIRQALTHPQKPILIDVKHMSVYSRLQYYRMREAMIRENEAIERLPIISSHSGFTFYSLKDFISNKRFRHSTEVVHGHRATLIEAENIQAGKTDDVINSGLFANPWTINLFDEEITEIMISNGLIGLSLDQRILGAGGFVDSKRKEFFVGEYISQPEFERLFRDGQLPGPEKIVGFVPSRAERHIMLLCLHIVHGVRVGYSSLTWMEGTSPWDHFCIGSDFDGLINPINRINDVTCFEQLKIQLLKYLPHADKSSTTYTSIRALRYREDGTVDKKFLEEAVDKIMFGNGHRFISRFLSNWK